MMKVKQVINQNRSALITIRTQLTAAVTPL